MTDWPDDPARDAVRYDWDHNLVVEAGAGTGKTTLLVDRAYEALATGRVTLSGIGLITFMDKAAVEVKGRLARRLVEQRRIRSEAALADAPITTLHGLAFRLLRMRAAQGGAPPPRVWDAIETERQRDAAFSAWFRERPDARREARALRALGISYAAWKQLVLSLPEAGQSPPGPLPVFPVAAAAEAILALEETARRLPIPADEPGVTQIVELAAEFRRLLRVPEADRAGLLLTLRWPAPRGAVARWKPYEDRLREQKETLARLKAEWEAWRRHFVDALAGGVGQAARDFRAYWQAWRRERHALTFDDLIADTVSALASDPRFRQDAARSLAVLWVDEFQDTDPAQVAMVQWLAADPDSQPTDPARAPIPPGRLVLVGDTKQAIYRFRGADVENAQRWMTMLVESGHARRIAITTNFRSVPAVVQAVNTAFPQLMTGVPPHPAYIPLHAARPPVVGPFPPVVRLAAPADGTTAEIRAGQAQVIAHYLHRAIAEGWPVASGTGVRPIRPRDMAVLLPRRTGIAAYRDALKAVGLPVLAAGARRFYEQPAVRGLAAVLRAATMPDDAVAVLAALRGVVFRVSDAELGRHRAAGGSWNPDDDQPVGPAGDALRTLRGWSRAVWDWGADGLLALAAARGALAADRETAANVDRLLDQAAQYAARWGTGPYAAWLWERVTRNDPADEADVPDLDGIRLTSIHQAKGLEWPLVVVAGLTTRGRPETAPVAVTADGRTAARVSGIASTTWDDAQAEAVRDREAEERRLWYVALTRARDYLAIAEPLPDLLDGPCAGIPRYDAGRARLLPPGPVQERTAAT